MRWDSVQKTISCDDWSPEAMLAILGLIKDEGLVGVPPIEMYQGDHPTQEIILETLLSVRRATKEGDDLRNELSNLAEGLKRALLRIVNDDIVAKKELERQS